MMMIFWVFDQLGFVAGRELALERAWSRQVGGLMPRVFLHTYLHGISCSVL